MWVKIMVWILLVIVVSLYERTHINKLPARARRRIWIVYWGIQIVACWPVVILIFDLKGGSHTKLLEDIYKPLSSLLMKK